MLEENKLKSCSPHLWDVLELTFLIIGFDYRKNTTRKGVITAIKLINQIINYACSLQFNCFIILWLCTVHFYNYKVLQFCFKKHQCIFYYISWNLGLYKNIFLYFSLNFSRFRWKSVHICIIHFAYDCIALLPRIKLILSIYKINLIMNNRIIMIEYPLSRGIMKYSRRVSFFRKGVSF